MTAVAHAAPGPADPDTVSRTPDDPDLQLARDPRAGAGRLMVLAGNRPDLRGVIVDNPGCSPELRAWVSRMGGASAGSGRGGRHGADDAASWTDDADDADNADNADNSVSLAPTGWESFTEQTARVADFIEELRNELAQKEDSSACEVLVFTHGGVLLSAELWAGWYPLEEAFSHQSPYGAICTLEL